MPRGGFFQTERNLKMTEIEINGKKIAVAWDAQAYFRYERAGGTAEEMQALADKRGSAAARISTVVILAWAMLKGDSRAEYPTAEDPAPLFIPRFDAAAAESLGNVIAAGNDAMKANL